MQCFSSMSALVWQKDASMVSTRFASGLSCTVERLNMGNHESEPGLWVLEGPSDSPLEIPAV